MTPAPDFPEPAGERRRRSYPTLSPSAILAELSALVMLEQLTAPALVVEHDGTVVFANSAFADMVGLSREAVMSLRFHQILPNVSISDSAVAVIDAHADQVVELRHRDGSTVRAHMSGSALPRDDDPFALVIFHDLTEQLWGKH